MANKQKQNEKRVMVGFIPSIVAFSSIFFWVPLQDAMNFPKFFVVVCILFPVLIYEFIVNEAQWKSLKIKKYFVSFLGFLSLLIFMSTITSGNVRASAFGANARYNGAVLYLVLIFMIFGIVRNSGTRTVSAFLNAFYIAAIINVIYSLLQFLNLDPVAWNLPFNRIVGVLGNPDFSSAFLGLASIYFAYGFLKSNTNKYLRYMNLILSILAFSLTIATQARQGSAIIVLGLLIAITSSAYKRRKVLGFLSLGVSGIVIAFSILGMLQVGPLSKYLYKESISYRGDYWRAGMNMLQEHFFFGVGFGRYGDFFRQYRDLKQVSRRGPNLISDQAHSVPIDFFASGGMIVGLIYLAGLVAISIMAVVVIKNEKDNEKFKLDVLLAALWFGYLGQSLISIDQIGLVIWGWVFAALIVVNYTQSNQTHVKVENVVMTKLSQWRLIAPIISVAFSIVLTISSIPIWQAEATVRIATGVSLDPAENPNGKSIAIQHSNELLAQNVYDGSYLRQGGIILASTGQIPSSLDALRRAIELNERDSVSFAVFGSILRQTGKSRESLSPLITATKLDPLNQMNYFELLQAYKALGNTKEASRMLQKMKNISSESTLYLEAENYLNQVEK